MPSQQPLSDDEAERLQELRSLGLLDTPREERFDVITQLAARSLNVPISLVSLVDQDRQWFKSRIGFEPDCSDRAISFCAHAIGEPEIMVVPDATLDPRFADNPLVTGDPHFRFYAGAVIRGPRGYPLGTLCLIDRQPRTLSDEDRGRLLYLARLVEWEIRQDQLIARMLLEVEKDKLHYHSAAVPDRRTIFEALAGAMTKGQPVAVALGKIEDAAGRPIGEANLAALQWELTRRLQSLPPPIQVGMWRQSQFMALMPSQDSSSSGVAPLVGALQLALEGDYETQVSQIPTRTRIGVAIFPADAEAVRPLLQCAQAAAQAGPDASSFHIGIYSRDVAITTRRAEDVVKRLWRALSDNSLRVEYQPIFDARTGALHSAEALLRWNDAQLGMVSPAEFIPLAEQSNLISAVGSFVLRKVVSQLVSWIDQQRVPVPIAVNVSSQQILSEGFADLVISLVRGANIDPALLTLEITEHALVSDFKVAGEMLSAVRDAGIHCTIDDFGVGFSSLNYIRRLPVTTLKIDREFIVGIELEKRAADVVGAIVGMARALGVSTTAEGVESEAQLQLLKSLGCTHVQGFHLGASETVERFTDRLTPSS